MAQSKQLLRNSSPTFAQRSLLGAMAFTLTLLCAMQSEAQRSGGRFGGSSGFRSSSSSSSYRSSSSSSSWRSSSSSSSSSWRSSSNSHYGGSSTTYYAPPPPPPPPWLTATQYHRPGPSDASAFISVGAYRSIAEPERVFEQQRFNQGQLKHGPFSYPGMAFGFLLSFTPLAALSWLVTRPARNAPQSPTNNYYGGYGQPVPSSASYGECEVRRVTLAFDHRARPALQAALDSIASHVDMSTPQGLWAGADQARQLLLQALANVSAAHVVSHKSSASGAEALFQRTCDDLNRRYDQATISNQRRNEAPDVRARREEGAGFVVVSIVVGINGNLSPIPNGPVRDTVQMVLRSLLPPNANDLASLEVVWSPSIDQDRLSSAEMAVLYPELKPIDSSVMMGRVSCSSCHNIYAKELGACPICGAKEAVASDLSAAQQAQVFAGAASSHTINCPFCRKPTPSYEVQCQHCGGRVKN